MAREVVIVYTLFIDTHDKNILIILYKNNKILVCENVQTINKHSEVAMPTIDLVLKKANIDVSELNSVIVVNGPGSFTGERIAVTIAKTIAYSLNIPIRVIDALTIMALAVNTDHKVVALEDRNGAFVGEFDRDNNIIDNFQYLNKSVYAEFKSNFDVNTDVDVNYELVYDHVMKLTPINPHDVKPLYIKGISALNGK